MKIDKLRDKREIMLNVICNKRDLVDQTKIDTDPIHKWSTKEKGYFLFM